MRTLELREVVRWCNEADELEPEEAAEVPAEEAEAMSALLDEEVEETPTGTLEEPDPEGELLTASRSDCGTREYETRLIFLYFFWSFVSLLKDLDSTVSLKRSLSVRKLRNNLRLGAIFVKPHV